MGPHENATVADLNRDGHVDIASGPYWFAGPPSYPAPIVPINYYQGRPAAGRFVRHTVSAPGEGVALGRQYAVTDLNQDGRPDLVAPSELGLWVFFNQGY